MRIVRYIPELMPLWDAFIRVSRNGVFLFERAYMDYHRDRFSDHSLMYYDGKDRLVGVLPATEYEENGERVLSSHAGLTFGGFVLSCEARSRDVLSLFGATLEYLRQNSYSRFVYKTPPVIYHQVPSEEEEYALWLNGAHLDICNLSTTIDLRSPALIAIDRNRTRCKRKALRYGYTIAEIDDLVELWPIVEHSLQRKYGVSPVHTLVEISLLHKRFPHNIRVFAIMLNGMVVGGVVIYESMQVAHSQYCHATPEAKSRGVIDMLYLHLIDYYKLNRPEIRYFDFGISNEEDGRYLNQNLIAYKEDYGGRGVAYKTWSFDL